MINARAQLLLMLLQLLLLCAEAPEAVALLDHPALNRDQAKELVATVFAGKVSDLSVNLLRLLVDRGRLGDLPGILQQLLNMMRCRCWEHSSNCFCLLMIVRFRSSINSGCFAGQSFWFSCC